jgi:hypothetical protein
MGRNSIAQGKALGKTRDTIKPRKGGTDLACVPRIVSPLQGLIPKRI